jgi:hypothetical protein
MEIEITNQKNCSNPTISVVNYTGNEIETNEQFTDLENGNKYSGPTLNGMPNGIGKEYCVEYLYEGNFLEGKWHGKGVLKKIVGNCIKIPGEFIDGYFVGI